MPKSVEADKFISSLNIQMRVIKALLLREIITRYGRYNLGFLWLFLEPMIFTLAITLLWSATKLSHASEFSITAFAVTGYSSVLLWRNTVGKCGSAISSNMALLHHKNVRIIDLFLSRIVLEILGASISFIVLGLFFYSFGLMELPKNLLQVLFGWVLLAWFGGALALCIGSLSEMSKIVERLWHPISYVLFPLSGAGFMVNWLPKATQGVVLLLPMVHGIELLREGFFGTAIQAHYSISYLVMSNVLLTFLGLKLVEKASLRVEAE